MGTNYYVVPNRPSIEEPIHIGKSSYGWMFLFQDVHEPYRDVPVVWHSFEELDKWLRTNVLHPSGEYVIMNEYDVIVSYNDFIDMIKYKQERFKDNPDNFTYCKNVNGYRFEEREFS